MNRFNSTYNSGSIEVIVGTMYSGKSRELIYRGQRAEKFGEIPVYYFKPEIDTRGGDLVMSRDGLAKRATLFKQSKDLLAKMDGKEKGLILIDEAQFADKDLIYVTQLLRSKGYNIVLSGLANDFRGQPFGVMPKLMALSDAPIRHIFSVCNYKGCHNDGVLPQRLRNGVPDSALSPTIIIEGSDNDDLVTYEPRCEAHHNVPDLNDYLLRKLNAGS